MDDRPDAAPAREYHVVLARPSESRNVGAACRASKSCGVRRLSVVSAMPFDVEAARPLAVGALDVLEAIERYESLEEAVAGSVLVAGVTRRLGQRRKSTPYTPWRFAEQAARLASGTVSIVFGNEQSGLSDDELACCQIAVRIPTSPECPSLNLSHAVQVICYELSTAAPRRRIRSGREETGTERTITAAALRRSVDAMVASLSSMGFLTQEGPQGMPQLLWEVFGRAGLSVAEAKRLEGLFAKLAGRSRR